MHQLKHCEKEPLLNEMKRHQNGYGIPTFFLKLNEDKLRCKAAQLTLDKANRAKQEIKDTTKRPFLN